MKPYKIRCYETFAVDYLVFAESKEDAVDICPFGRELGEKDHQLKREIIYCVELVEKGGE